MEDGVIRDAAAGRARYLWTPIPLRVGLRVRKPDEKTTSMMKISDFRCKPILRHTYPPPLPHHPKSVRNLAMMRRFFIHQPDMNAPRPTIQARLTPTKGIKAQLVPQESIPKDSNARPSSRGQNEKPRPLCSNTPFNHPGAARFAFQINDDIPLCLGVL